MPINEQPDSQGPSGRPTSEESSGCIKLRTPDCLQELLRHSALFVGGSAELRPLWVESERLMAAASELGYLTSLFWMGWAQQASTDESGRGFLDARIVLDCDFGPDVDELPREARLFMQKEQREAAQKLQAAGFWHLEGEAIFVFDRPDIVLFTEPAIQRGSGK